MNETIFKIIQTLNMFDHLSKIFHNIVDYL